MDADICIVGAGAAGITLARALVDSGLSVLVCEGGNLEPEVRGQRLLAGKIGKEAYPALDTTRLRCFGGTTQHWTGWCRPLDAIDFEERPGLPYSGWPFALEDLLPWYEQAQAVCGLGACDYSPTLWAEETGLELLPIRGDSVETCIWQFSAPRRFGTHFREELGTARNVTVCLGSNVVALETDRRAARVTRLRIARFDSEPIFASCHAVVLAAGGIENARLLLASDSEAPGGLGNRYDLVGRFFMEHPHTLVGKVLCALPGSATRLYESVVDISGGRPAAVRAGFALSEERRRIEGLCGFSVTLEPAHTPPDRALAEGVEESLAALYQKAPRQLDLLARTEQVPNPESRVVLDTDRDEFGMRRAILEWQIDPLTRRTIARGVELVATALGRSGIGRVFSYAHSPTPGKGDHYPAIGGGYHHMGTTRMHVDPARGVVDENCRVHGTENLFIAGSSVFPTGGFGNPTLTLVSLTLRLASHLSQEASL